MYKKIMFIMKLIKKLKKNCAEEMITVGNNLRTRVENHFLADVASHLLNCRFYMKSWHQHSWELFRQTTLGDFLDISLESKFLDNLVYNILSHEVDIDHAN